METTWLINGRNSHVDAADRGLAYGDGLFETMAVRNGRIRWLDLHLERLNQGCRRLGFNCPDVSLLKSETLAACPPTGKAVAKLIVTRGKGSRGYGPPENPVPTRILSIGGWPAYPDSHYTAGITLIRLAMRLGENPILAGMKHLSRLEQVMAQRELRDTKADEGLLLSSGLEVIGGTMSNLFMVKGNRISTPSLERCGVHGVMRRVVLEHLGSRQTQSYERSISMDELQQADEIFMTNAIFGIWPVRSLDGRPLSVGPITRELIQALRIGPCA